MSWIKQQAETELLWELGSEYPIALFATVYEENELGERRLVETKQFKLVATKEADNETNQI